jgi:hypothetical protein
MYTAVPLKHIVHCCFTWTGGAPRAALRRRMSSRILPMAAGQGVVGTEGEGGSTGCELKVRHIWLQGQGSSVCVYVAGKGSMQCGVWLLEALCAWRLAASTKKVLGSRAQPARGSVSCASAAKHSVLHHPTPATPPLSVTDTSPLPAGCILTCDIPFNFLLSQHWALCTPATGVTHPPCGTP